MITELFKQILEEYPLCRETQNFAKNPMAEILRHQLPDAFRESVPLGDQYMVRGSAGRGQWARVPWLGILDRRVTSKPTEGVYIVYAFASDGHALFALLTQGGDKPLKKSGEGTAKARLIRTAEKIREKVATPTGFSADNEIKTGSHFYDNSVIFHRDYPLKNLPNDRAILADCNLLLDAYQHYYTAFHA